MWFYMAASKAREKKTPTIGYFKIYLKSEYFS